MFCVTGNKLELPVFDSWESSAQGQFMDFFTREISSDSAIQ